MLRGIVRARPGANLHTEPRGDIIKGVLDGTALDVLGDEPTVKDGYPWLFVREAEGPGRWGYMGAAFVAIVPRVPDVPRCEPEPQPLEPRPPARDRRKRLPWGAIIAVAVGLGLIMLALAL